MLRIQHSTFHTQNVMKVNYVTNVISWKKVAVTTLLYNINKKYFIYIIQ